MGDEGAAGGLFLGLVVGVIIGVIFATNITNEQWHTDLINRGHAIYCPINGEFAYKGECQE